MSNNKPHGFCETPEEKCTMNYCDENGCINRKRNPVGDGDPIEMSNNKQIMKLYTEEQVIQMIEKSRETGLTAEYLILTTPPIQLPSDEEIEEMGKDVIIYNDTKRGWFIEGLKFMRDKIQGGNK